ncbi:MAG: hypothetical protein WC829_20160 [Hyphomicrobium sp.]|jgi:hypothetical protein
MTGYSTGGQNISGQFGMPLYGIAGLLPFTGNIFFVDQTLGSDGNTGGPQDPLKTLGAAHDKCVADNNDVVFLTGTVHLTATLTWSKSRTHLIGLAPNLLSQARARISNTGANVFTPLVNITASECIFRDIGTFMGMANASAQICVTVSGGRNEFTRCLFGGMGDATAAAQAGGRSLLITGTTGENTFRECQIGLDTITRSAANASVEFAGGTPRNVFERCIFPALTSSATALFGIATGAAAMDRFQLFQDCSFINALKSTGIAMTAGFAFSSASPGGLLLMKTCTAIGLTKWGDTNALANMYVDGGAPTAATTGLALAPT